MATRSIFIPILDGKNGVNEVSIDFSWHPGMASVQKKKNINELHTAARKKGYEKILEISSKSELSIGVKLSAFNLCITTKKKGFKFTVESAFQGSKVFENGGPYKDLIGMDSLSAKKDHRLKTSGNLISFEFFGRQFPNVPRTFFYDWLYINALAQNIELANSIVEYTGFSDIEFNPKKSINCQAYSAALFVSLKRNHQLNDALYSAENFLEITREQYENRNNSFQVQNSIL